MSISDNILLPSSLLPLVSVCLGAPLIITMLPTYRRLDGTLVTPSGTSVVCRLSMMKLSRLALALTFGAFVFVISWSILYNFEDVTHTHCGVANYLPSVSSAIGNHEPQRTIWTILIALHFPIRLVIVHMYLRLYRDQIRSIYQWCVSMLFGISLLENFGLLFLSLWTSSINYEIHKRSFTVFVVCAEIYMISTYFLTKYGRILPMTNIEKRSMRFKRNITLINITSLTFAVYFFYRHNKFCEPGSKYYKSFIIILLFI